MARATQLRLNQITGSFGSTQINEDITAAATSSIAATDFTTVISHLAGAIKRIHGDNSFSESASGEFHQDLKLNSTNKLQFTDSGMFIHGSADGKLKLSSDGNAEDAILIEADGGVNETIRLHADQGTGVNAKGGSTDASISLHSDVGGIGLYSGINADNAIALEANGGVNETIQIRSNQGTGVATANIANHVNASIALISDVGGVALASGLNGARAISIEADAGTSETVVVSSNQGNTATSVTLNSDVGGISILAGSTTHGVKIGTGTSGAPVTIGHGTSEVTIGDNLTVSGNTTLAGDLTILSDTTTVISSSNTVIQDSIIGLGFSGSNDSGAIFNNVGDRAIIFGRAAQQHAALPALNYDGSEFEFATFLKSPASSSMGAHTAGVPVRTGHLKPISDDGATLGDANERWSDLFLASGGVINFDNGNFRLTHSANALTIDTNDKLQFRDANTFIHSNDANDLLASANQDITLDAGNDIIFDAASEKIALKKAGTEVGSLIMDADNGQGLVVSSSLNQAITLDSNQGFIILGQSSLDGGTNGAAFVVGANSLQVEQTTYDPSGGHTAFKFAHNDTYANQHLQISGSLRFYKSNAGDRYVAIDVNNPGTNYNITLPDSVATANDDILVSDTSGNLSFKSTATLGIGTGDNVSRTNLIIAQAVASGSELNPNSASVSNTAPSSRANLNLSGVSNANLPNHVDIFVNGQLLLSGSDANVGAGTADYFVNVHNAASRIKFAFGLEVSDVVSILRKV